MARTSLGKPHLVLHLSVSSKISLSLSFPKHPHPIFSKSPPTPPQHQSMHLSYEIPKTSIGVLFLLYRRHSNAWSFAFSVDHNMLIEYKLVVHQLGLTKSGNIRRRLVYEHTKQSITFCDVTVMMQLSMYSSKSALHKLAHSTVNQNQTTSSTPHTSTTLLNPKRHPKSSTPSYPQSKPSHSH